MRVEGRDALFSIRSATKENLMPLFFTFLKGRNNDFLLAMQLSASLVEC